MEILLSLEIPILILLLAGCLIYFGVTEGLCKLRRVENVLDLPSTSCSVVRLFHSGKG